MSIFKYLTLSHLQKVLAALEVRFKGIENKVSEIENNAGSGGSSTLFDLTDTTISSPTNGEVLMYNSTSGKWENTTLPVYNGGVSS